jgi:hypothetical protein
MASDRHANSPAPDAPGEEPPGVEQSESSQAQPPLEPLLTSTDEDRRRVLIIALFCVGSLVLAIAVAFFYAMPSAG